MVTVIVSLPGAPSRDLAKVLIVEQHMSQLMNLFDEHYGVEASVVDDFYLMSFTPGSYPPATDGFTMDNTIFHKAPAGSIRWAFGITSDRPPEFSRLCVGMIIGDREKNRRAGPSTRENPLTVELGGDDGKFPDER